MDTLSARLTLWLWRITSAQAIIGLGVLAIYWRHLPPQVPLLYTRPWGELQLVSPYYLWLIPIVAGGLGLGTGLGIAKLTTDRVLQVMFTASVVIAEIILCLGLMRIILLVT